MTEQTQPTDAELMELSNECKKMPGGMGYYYRNFARAVLAKWGTPAGAGEVVAYLHKHKHSGMVDLSLHRMADNDFNRARWECIPLYSAPSTPQPTQAQAGAVPFNKTQRTNLFNNRDLASEKNMGVKLTLAEWHRIVQYIEAAHGIKGADHA